MIPAAFDYQRADSAEQAIALLTEHGDEAKLLAGGHSLLPLMKLRLASPSVLIDVGRLTRPVLRPRRRRPRRHRRAHPPPRPRDLRRCSQAEVPILAHAAGHVGDPQVRHRGTIGGSLAHADPASDLPAVVLALGGTMVAQGPNGDARDRRRPTSTRASSSRPSSPTSCSPRSACPRSAAPAGRSRSSTAGPRTGPSSAWPLVRNNGSSGVGLVNMGSTPIFAQGVVDAMAGGRVGRRRRRARGRRRRAAVRHQRLGRVPHPPGPGARAPGPRRSRRLTSSVGQARSVGRAGRGDEPGVSGPSGPGRPGPGRSRTAARAARRPRTTHLGDLRRARPGLVGLGVVDRAGPEDEVDALRVGVDHDGRLADQLDAQADLLEHLAPGGVGRRLAPLQQAAGDAPACRGRPGGRAARRRRPARCGRWRRP